MDKAYILNEIRRTAAANRGQALGQHSFYEATGIRSSDWQGKHWARFSDAVKEAGLTPKEFQDEKKYTDEDLLGRYARFAHQLGHLPSLWELRLKRRSDEELPNSGTYDSRFGSKFQLVTRLRDCCLPRPEYADVIRWCDEYLAKHSNKSVTASGAERETGYVYLMKMGKYFKIGRANDLVRRGREITIQLPEKATMIHFFATDDPSGIEAYWHRRFEDKRREGEWFELDAKDIAAFRRRKSFM